MACSNPNKSCLVAYLNCFSDREGGFEHPIDFYDDEAATSETTSDDKGRAKKHRYTEEEEPRKRRWRFWISLALLLLIIALIVSLVVSSKRRKSQSRASALSRQNSCGRRLDDAHDNLPPWSVDMVRRLDDEVSDFVSIGCFGVESSRDNRTVAAPTFMERAVACDAACSTNYFGIASDNREFKNDDEKVTCYCYVERPKNRFSIGPCSRIEIPVLEDPCVDGQRQARQEMEVFFDPHLNEVCNQETTSTVRNFLVEEDDAPFGFDIVKSEFRPSPFELYKDECGTNIYEVQTEVSEGNRQLTTSVMTVEEYVDVQRGDLADSIYGSYSGGGSHGWPFFMSASRHVAGTSDRRQINVMESAGAQEAGSNVFSSFGVKRLAEVQIVDFENKVDFVTFNAEFGSLLRTYRQNGFERSTAQQIFRTYGMFVVTRGIFGGYLELRSTMVESDVLNMFSELEAARQCYEEYASTRARHFGFYGSSPTSTADCDADAIAAFDEARRAYEMETGEVDVVGGNAADSDLAVTPATSTLLTSSDMYPLGDSGLAIRPLTDFLSPRVVSPLEVKRYQITEVEFAELQEKLQSHLEEELSELEAVLDQCADCDVPYMVQSPESWGFDCTCYDPEPSVSLFESIAATYKVEIRRIGQSSWGEGDGNQGTLVIPLHGPIIYNGRYVTEYEYDADRQYLSWDEHGEIMSRAELTFYEADESFFSDRDITGAKVFWGVIDDGWYAADEIRGYVEDGV